MLSYLRMLQTCAYHYLPCSRRPFLCLPCQHGSHSSLSCRETSKVPPYFRLSTFLNEDHLTVIALLFKGRWLLDWYCTPQEKALSANGEINPNKRTAMDTLLLAVSMCFALTTVVGHGNAQTRASAPQKDLSHPACADSASASWDDGGEALPVIEQLFDENSSAAGHWQGSENMGQTVYWEPKAAGSTTIRISVDDGTSDNALGHGSTYVGGDCTWGANNSVTGGILWAATEITDFIAAKEPIYTNVQMTCYRNPSNE